MVKNFILIKSKNYYDEDYTKYLMSDNGQDKILTGLLQTGKPKITNKWLDKFSSYVIDNLPDIVSVMSSRPKGKLSLIQDSRYLLPAYVTSHGDMVINFSKRLNEYSRSELLSILMYGFTYWAVFFNHHFQTIDLWLMNQIMILHTFMMNLFGKKHGTFGDPDLIDMSLYYCGLHVTTNFWGEPFKKYSSHIISHFKLTKIEDVTIKNVIGLDKLNFDIDMWVDLLDKEVFRGITAQAITARVANSFSLSMLAGLESLDRFFAVLYGSKFSPLFGGIDYYTPDDKMDELSLEVTKYLISSFEV